MRYGISFVGDRLAVKAHCTTYRRGPDPIVRSSPQ
jgi:hypothetical protein